MTKSELIEEIRTAFKDVKLEDGVGLWEGQGLDDRADRQALLELRKRDERNDWDNISYEDLVNCASSLSFFDAKGMRFCLPKFLILDVLEKELHKEQGITLDCEMLYHLSCDPDEHLNAFSLFDKQQTQCVIHYLEYRAEKLFTQYKEYSIKYGSTEDSVYLDSRYTEISRILNIWKQKIN